MFGAFIGTLRDREPLVHCITNYVTVNDCANALLAIGGSPIMSDEIKDATEIAGIASALVINIGTLNERTVETMVAAGQAANKNNVPVVLDPVGVGATKYRTEVTKLLLEKVNFTVIRGNISEIGAIYKGHSSGRGVDAGAMDMMDVNDIADMAKKLSEKTGAVIAVTGKVDVVADKDNAYAIYNGSHYMSKITGSGCMLSCVLGAFVGAIETRLEAVVCGVSAMGIAGEIAEKKMSGTGSFRVAMIDGLSNMCENIFNEGNKIERL